MTPVRQGRRRGGRAWSSSTSSASPRSPSSTETDALHAARSAPAASHIECHPARRRPRLPGVLRRPTRSAVFQFESRGMRDLLMKAKPDRLRGHHRAWMALYRPGPMDLIPEFIERKHGKRRWDYLDPRLKAILEPTYGIIVYQEQVMPERADHRRFHAGRCRHPAPRHGQKNPEEMAKKASKFVGGREVKPDTKALARRQIFDLMEKFAGYGFNKSHAAAYALFAYQTAYLKAHYAGRVHGRQHVLRHGQHRQGADPRRGRAGAKSSTSLAPDINSSDYRFPPVDAKTVPYGLGAIKGRGESAIIKIVEAPRRETVPRPVRFHPSRRQAPGEPPHDRTLILAAAPSTTLELPTARPCSPRWASRWKRPSRPSRAPSQVSLFGGTDGAETEALELVKTCAMLVGTRAAGQRESRASVSTSSGHPVQRLPGRGTATVRAHASSPGSQPQQRDRCCSPA